MKTLLIGAVAGLAALLPGPASAVEEAAYRGLLSDGAFELIVWNEKASGTDDVVVKLRGTHPTVRIYDPTTGTAPVQTLTNADSVSLTLSDHPLIIEME